MYLLPGPAWYISSHEPTLAHWLWQNDMLSCGFWGWLQNSQGLWWSISHDYQGRRRKPGRWVYYHPFLTADFSFLHLVIKNIQISCPRRARNCRMVRLAPCRLSCCPRGTRKSQCCPSCILGVMDDTSRLQTHNPEEWFGEAHWKSGGPQSPDCRRQCGLQVQGWWLRVWASESFRPMSKALLSGNTGGGA